MHLRNGWITPCAISHLTPGNGGYYYYNMHHLRADIGIISTWYPACVCVDSLFTPLRAFSHRCAIFAKPGLKIYAYWKIESIDVRRIFLRCSISELRWWRETEVARKYTGTCVFRDNKLQQCSPLESREGGRLSAVRAHLPRRKYGNVSNARFSHRGIRMCHARQDSRQRSLVERNRCARDTLLILQWTVHLCVQPL